MASAASVATGPRSPATAPPRGGPAMVAVQVADSSRALAATSSSGGTSHFRKAPWAARKAMSAVAATTATTRSWANDRTPST